MDVAHNNNNDYFYYTQDDIYSAVYKAPATFESLLWVVRTNVGQHQAAVNL